jgi:threonine dehydratase
MLDWLQREHPEFEGIITATRGNHGQSQARAASALGLKAEILVPKGNAREKNAAMRAFGGHVVEFGDDFDAAREEAMRRSAEDKLFMVPPFHRELLRGVASYALELFQAKPDLDKLYVPIGCGSGICSCILVRDLLGLDTEIIGVVAENADAIKQSVQQHRLIETDSARTFADGMAVRVPVQEAYDIYSTGMSDIVAVSEDEIAEAIRLIYQTTHNVAEGAGASGLAAILQQRVLNQGKQVGFVLSGGNIDQDVFQTVLAGKTPEVA